MKAPDLAGAAGRGVEASGLELICRDVLVARGRRHWLENSGCEAHGSFTVGGFRLGQGGRVLLVQGVLDLAPGWTGLAEVLGGLTVELRARGAEPVALVDSLRLAPGSAVLADSSGTEALRAAIGVEAESLGLEVCGGECSQSDVGGDTVLLVMVGVLPRVSRRDGESRGRDGDRVFRVALPEGTQEERAEQVGALGRTLRDSAQEGTLAWVGSCRDGGLLAAADWVESTGMGLKLDAGGADFACLTAAAPSEFLISAVGEEIAEGVLSLGVLVQEVGEICAERRLDLKTDAGPTLRLWPEEIRRDQSSPEFPALEAGSAGVLETREDYEGTLFELLADFRRDTPRMPSPAGGSGYGVSGGGGNVVGLRLGARRDLLALAIGSAQHFSGLDPYIGACLAVCRVTRALAAAGAEPLGLLITLPGERVPGASLVYEGLRHAADALGTTIEMATAAGDGFAMPGVVAMGRPTANHLLPPRFQQAGDLAVLLGRTREELDGSVYDAHLRGIRQGTPPWVDLENERRLQDMVRAAGESELLKSACGLGSGGLIRGTLHACGVDVPSGSLLGLQGDPDESLRPEAWLFAESPSRMLVSVAPNDLPLLKEKASRAEVPVHFLGKIGGDRLEINGQLRVALESLRRAWHGSKGRAG